MDRPHLAERHLARAPGRFRRPDPADPQHLFAHFPEGFARIGKGREHVALAIGLQQFFVFDHRLRHARSEFPNLAIDASLLGVLRRCGMFQDETQNPLRTGLYLSDRVNTRQSVIGYFV